MSANLGGIRQALDSAKIIAAMGAMKAMSRAGESLKEDLRDQIRSAGFSERLAKTWQLRVFPDRAGRVSLTPAALVGSRAPAIIDSYARGATIVATGGRRFLAIPTDDTPRKRQGNALTPREVEARYHRSLRFVPAKGAAASGINGKAIGYLVMDLLIARKESGRFRRASSRELASRIRNKGRAVQSVVMFTLVRSVKVPKKLDLQGALDKASATLPQLLSEEWSRG